MVPANNDITPTVNGIIPVFSLTIDPHDYSVVWAGIQGTGRLYRSSDSGQTWETRNNGITSEGGSVRGIVLAACNYSLFCRAC